MTTEDQIKEARRELHRELRELWVSAGRPSSRQLTADLPLSFAYASQILAGATSGSTRSVMLLVEKLGGDMGKFRRLCENANLPVSKMRSRDAQARRGDTLAQILEEIRAIHALIEKALGAGQPFGDHESPGRPIHPS